MSRGYGIIARYRDFLPLAPSAEPVTLGEGDTPLLAARAISKAVGGLPVYLKVEGQNPTGSFKDRGMTVAMTQARSRGARAVICASTGNTAASAAAYAARAGLPAFVVIPAGGVAMGKLAQAMAHGATVVQLNGNFDDALRLVRALAARHPEVELVNSVNPYRLQGQKTAAFEIVDALGAAPAYMVLPVGNAGNISAYWMGFKEYRAAGRATGLPVMLGIQAEGAASMVRGHDIDQPVTIASAIRIGRPASRELARQAAEESGGGFAAVPDEEIVAAQRLLAQEEGVFCEPASAASVAGLMHLYRAGYWQDRPVGSVVCVLTGHGLKDPEAAGRIAPAPVRTGLSLGELERVLGLEESAHEEVGA